jgi:hypothetical protein
MAKLSFAISAKSKLIGKTMGDVLRCKAGIKHLASWAPDWLRARPEWRTIVTRYNDVLIDVMPGDRDVVCAFATYGKLTKSNLRTLDFVFEKLYGVNDGLLVEFLARGQRVGFARLYELLKNKPGTKSFMVLLSGNNHAIYDVTRLKGILRWWWLKQIADVKPVPLYKYLTGQIYKPNIGPAQWMLREYKQTGWKMIHINLTARPTWWNCQLTWRVMICRMAHPYRMRGSQTLRFIAYFERLVAATRQDAGLMSEFARLVAGWPFLVDQHLQMFRKRIGYLGRKSSAERVNVERRLKAAKSDYESLVRSLTV